MPTPYERYMQEKIASNILTGAAVGAAAGALNGKFFPAEFSMSPRSDEDEKRDIGLSTGIGAGMGAAVGKYWDHPEFHAATKAEEVAGKAKNALKEVGPIARRLLPLVARVKTAAGPFGIFGVDAPQQQYDPQAHAKILRAKASLSRAKLMYGASFRKMEPTAQQDLLRAHDKYHRSIEDAVLTGKYGGF